MYGKPANGAIVALHGLNTGDAHATIPRHVMLSQVRSWINMPHAHRLAGGHLDASEITTTSPECGMMHCAGISFNP
jgi:hypothetical protein